MAELQEAANMAERGVRDHTEMRKACERMDRMRDELKKRHGEMNVAVDLIRETRDEA